MKKIVNFFLMSLFLVLQIRAMENQVMRMELKSLNADEELILKRLKFFYSRHKDTMDSTFCGSFAEMLKSLKELAGRPLGKELHPLVIENERNYPALRVLETMAEKWDDDENGNYLDVLDSLLNDHEIDLNCRVYRKKPAQILKFFNTEEGVIKTLKQHCEEIIENNSSYRCSANLIKAFVLICKAEKVQKKQLLENSEKAKKEIQ